MLSSTLSLHAPGGIPYLKLRSLRAISNPDIAWGGTRHPSPACLCQTRCPQPAQCHCTAKPTSNYPPLHAHLASARHNLEGGKAGTGELWRLEKEREVGSRARPCYAMSGAEVAPGANRDWR